MAIKYSKGKCNGCDRETVIVNKTHGLCPICNKQMLGKQKTPRHGSDDDNNDNKSQISLFKTLWDNSNKKCQLTGKDLSWITPMSKYWFSCFAHILPKGKYPRFKYNINNILLVHPDVHYQLDFGTKDSQLKELGEGVVNRWNELRSELLRVYPF